MWSTVTELQGYEVRGHANSCRFVRVDETAIERKDFVPSFRSPVQPGVNPLRANAGCLGCTMVIFALCSNETDAYVCQFHQMLFVEPFTCLFVSMQHADGRGSRCTSDARSFLANSD